MQQSCAMPRCGAERHQFEVHRAQRAGIGFVLQRRRWRLERPRRSSSMHLTILVSFSVTSLSILTIRSPTSAFRRKLR